MRPFFTAVKQVIKIVMDGGYNTTTHNKGNMNSPINKTAVSGTETNIRALP